MPACFCEMSLDGMTRDTTGKVYLTGKGVFVFDENDKRFKHIELPEPWTANLGFGGKDHRTLFTTASKGLYAIQMKFAGATAAK